MRGPGTKGKNILNIRTEVRNVEIKEKTAALRAVDARADRLCALSDLIWDHAETAFTEHCSAAALIDALRREDFEVAEHVGGIDTAFTGTFGSGRPVIGILGEFDALSGLSQKAGCCEQAAEKSGAPGHGCGHNLLGVGSLAAAIAVRDYLRATGASGTVVYFGCPGEEGGSGKAFMAKKHVFDGLDAALTWHPDSLTHACTGRTLANYQAAFRFYGKAAHAGGAPHQGRSALDALELMNVGVQFLREHVIPEARIHYAITDTGGFSPNVVQPYAEALYLVRAPRNELLEPIWQRVIRCAEGAAHMTDTRMEFEFRKGCSNLLSNAVLARLLYDNYTALPPIVYDAQDRALAAGIAAASQDTLGEALRKFAARLPAPQRKQLLTHAADTLYDFPAPYDPTVTQEFGSTDVGDVSWCCPTAQIYCCTMAAGTPGHSWQLVAQGKSGLAHKGMLQAGKAMAGAAIDLLRDPALLPQAREAFEADLDGETYRCPIPDGCEPRPLV